jgi:hypothetical protein
MGCSIQARAPRSANVSAPQSVNSVNLPERRTWLLRDYCMGAASQSDRVAALFAD